MSEPVPFPFSAVVGQDDVKLALVLTTVDRHIGGVLLRGEKGSAKSTLARALASLLPGRAPFVELPVGATEDRLVGTIDLEAVLVDGRRRLQPGLLASAHTGVLYVDEVNLLPDHLVDVLLDVAASGVNRVEREGVSESHPSRFVLIGSMNPEEGELRPQLLDRFGLAVDVTTTGDADMRAQAVIRRMAFDADRAGFASAWATTEAELRERLATCGPAHVPHELVRVASALCASVGAEGLRADLVMCRAAAALAGWEQRAEATVEDMRRVAPLALAHRRRRSPFEEPGIEQEEIDRALSDATGPDEDHDGCDRDVAGDGDERHAETPKASRPVPMVAPRSHRLDTASGRRSVVEGSRGRLIGDRTPDAPITSVAVGATLRASVLRRAGTGDDRAVTRDDLREAVREQRTGNLIVLAVDASGSMGAEQRMEAVKGAVLGLLLDAYQRRDRVALVTFRDDRADVVLRPTGSVEVARARLAELRTGGRTPLAAGIDAGLKVALSATGTSHDPLLVVVSDGRATAGPEGVDPVDAALDAGARVLRRGVPTVVIDAEPGPTRLGLAAKLAESMGAPCLVLPEPTASALADALRKALRR